MIIDLQTESGYGKYTSLMNEGIKVFANYFDVSEKQLVITCGATGALHAVFSHFPGGNLAIMPFEYFDIFTFASLHKCSVSLPVQTDTQSNDVAAFCDLIKKEHSPLVYISLPNNPLGQNYSEDEIKQIVTSLADDQVCVFDQTLLIAKPLTTEFFRKWGATKQIIIIGSFSKSHNLVNERIGYMFMPCMPVAFHPYAHAPAAQSLKKVMKVIGDNKYASKVIGLIEINNALIASWAQKQSEFVWSESKTNFGVIHARTVPASSLAQKLKNANILVKTNTDLKCPGNFLRIPLGESPTSIKKFLKAMAA